MNPAVAARVAAGTYRDWDDLNLTYRLRDIDAAQSDNGEIRLSFFGHIHAAAPGRTYAGTPGVLSIRPVALSQADDHISNLFPRRVGTQIRYLFRLNRGPRTSDQYMYFSTEGDQRTFVGWWDTMRAARPPLWLDEALENIDEYTSWFNCCEWR